MFYLILKDSSGLVQRSKNKENIHEELNLKLQYYHLINSSIVFSLNEIFNFTGHRIGIGQRGKKRGFGSWSLCKACQRHPHMDCFDRFGNDLDYDCCSLFGKLYLVSDFFFLV